MVDGEENFRLKYQKMSEAKSSIYVANYDLDPNLQLIRRGTIPQSARTHGLIASPCRSQSLESYTQNSVDGATDDFDYTLQNLLMQKAKQKII
jgi:hypothetical protein